MFLNLWEIAAALIQPAVPPPTMQMRVMPAAIISQTCFLRPQSDKAIAKPQGVLVAIPQIIFRRKKDNVVSRHTGEGNQ